MYLARIAGQEVELPQMPHTREEMYLDAIANNGGGGGGSSVQSDWNVNDPASPAYVKNRPFYTSDPVPTTVFEGTDIPFLAEGGKYGAGGLSLSLEAGKIYDVTWDGVLYSGFTATTATVFGTNTVFIGNISLLDDSAQDTEESFVIVSGIGIIVTSEAGETHSILITALEEQVTQLPSKYLADVIDSIPDVTVVRYERGVVLNCDELKAAATQNKPIIFQNYGANYIAHVNQGTGQIDTIDFQGVEWIQGDNTGITKARFRRSRIDLSTGAVTLTFGTFATTSGPQ